MPANLIVETRNGVGIVMLNRPEIRNAFDRRNTIEGVQAMRGEELEITKEGGEAIVTASWSTKVPVIANFSACLDFSVTTAK